jgi:hypothetical protein
MSWQTILKVSFPDSKEMFVFRMLSVNSRNKMFKEIEELDLSVSANRNKLGYIKNLLKTIKEGNPTLESLFTQPHLDAMGITLSEIKEHIEKLETIINEEVFISLEEAEKLADLGMKAMDTDDLQEIKRVLEEIDTKANLSERNLRRNKKLRAKIGVLRQVSTQPYLSFEGIPENSKILEEFAEKINGKAVGSIIQVDYNNDAAFIKAVKPANCDIERVSNNPDDFNSEITDIKFHYRVKNKKTGETYSPDSKKEEIYKYFMINLKQYKWKFHVGGKEVKLDKLTQETNAFIAANVKYSLTATFTTDEVMKYIAAVEDIPKGINLFKPKKFSNNNPVPAVMFLNKTSSTSDKRMLLSPFTEIIIKNDFTDKNTWFSLFFKQIRRTQMMGDTQAEAEVVNSIYLSIRRPERKNEFGFTKEEIESLITRINAIGNESIENKKEGVVKQAIRKFVKSATGIGASFSQQVKQHKENQLTYLQEGFTSQEVAAFKENHKKQNEGEDEEQPLRDTTYEIEWFKDGTKLEDYTKLDKDGNEIRDSQGKLVLFNEYDNVGSNLGGYAIITLTYDDDETAKYTPEMAYNDEMQLSATGVSSNYKEQNKITIASLIEEIEEMKEKRIILVKKPNRKAQLIELDNQIKGMEERLAARKESNLSPTDIKDAIREFRSGHSQEDFAAYVIIVAKKLKDTGGLTELMSRPSTSTKGALEKVSAETSLYYLSKMSGQAASDAVGQAFKRIDTDPNSDEAKTVAKELNDIMPTEITTIKTAIIKSFEDRLVEFIDNPEEFRKDKIIPANKAFLENNLIKAGE